MEKLSGTKKAIVEYPKTPSRPSATAAATAAAAAAAALGKPLPSGTAGSSGALSALAAEWRPTPAEAQAARPGRGRWGEDPGAAAAASSSLGIVDVLEEQESLAAQLLLPSQLLDSPISPPDPRQSDTPPLPLPLPLPLSSLGQSKH